MTLGKFEQLLKTIDPKFKLRQRGYGDIGGLFFGHAYHGSYIARLSKGELQMKGYRAHMVDPATGKEAKGPIQKRGRQTLINLIRNRRMIKNHWQRSLLTWGRVKDYGRVTS